jgi:hypothetical protein
MLVKTAGSVLLLRPSVIRCARCCEIVKVERLYPRAHPNWDWRAYHKKDCGNYSFTWKTDEYWLSGMIYVDEWDIVYD